MNDFLSREFTNMGWMLFNNIVYIESIDDGRDKLARLLKQLQQRSAPLPDAWAAFMRERWAGYLGKAHAKLLFELATEARAGDAGALEVFELLLTYAYVDPFQSHRFGAKQDTQYWLTPAQFLLSVNQADAVRRQLQLPCDDNQPNQALSSAETLSLLKRYLVVGNQDVRALERLVKQIDRDTWQYEAAKTGADCLLMLAVQHAKITTYAAIVKHYPDNAALFRTDQLPKLAWQARRAEVLDSIMTDPRQRLVGFEAKLAWLRSSLGSGDDQALVMVLIRELLSDPEAQRSTPERICRMIVASGRTDQYRVALRELNATRSQPSGFTGHESTDAMVTALFKAQRQASDFLNDPNLLTKEGGEFVEVEKQPSMSQSLWSSLSAFVPNGW